MGKENLPQRLKGEIEMIIKSGKVEIKNPLTIEEFDEDDGWIAINIPVGVYKYRIMDMNGWTPQQVFINGEWVDLGGQCPEVNAIM
jgi:hypothetical protein